MWSLAGRVRQFAVVDEAEDIAKSLGLFEEVRGWEGGKWLSMSRDFIGKM